MTKENEEVLSEMEILVRNVKFFFRFVRSMNFFLAHNEKRGLVEAVTYRIY